MEICNIEFVKKVRNNDKDAIDFLYKNKPYLHKIIQKFGIYDDIVVDNLSSDVIVIFWESCKKKDFVLNDGVKLTSYLWRVAKNLTMNYMKKEQKTVPIDELWNIEDEKQPDLYGISHKQYSMKMAIEMLSDTSRKFITMIMEGYTTKEIIAEFDYKSSDVVKSKKLKIKKAIKENLKAYNFSEQL